MYTCTCTCIYLIVTPIYMYLQYYSRRYIPQFFTDDLYNYIHVVSVLTQMVIIISSFFLSFFLTYSGMSGSGKTFTCDRLIIKMFSESTKSEWLQDIRKVFTCACNPVFICNLIHVYVTKHQRNRLGYKCDIEP